jgi:cell division septation protein DedD
MISIQDFNPFHSKEQSHYVMEEIDTKMDAISYEQSIDEITSTLPEDVSVFSYQMDYETFIPVKVKEESIAEPVVEIKEIPKPAKVVKEPKKAIATSKEIANATVESGSRHLIVGCFSTADNANRLVAQLKAKGYNAYVVDVVNGLHRVSAANANTDSALNQTNSRLSSLKISGWILRK